MQPRSYNMQRIQAWDETWCLRFNRASAYPCVRHVFLTVSRLGDGILWYGLMLGLLIIDPFTALLPVLHMIGVGAVSTVVYKWLKHMTHRPRPCDAQHDINCVSAPLDQFSFPSGHTLHAVSFSMVALAYYPVLAWLLVPFTALVAISRLVLGLHYPSDVLAGTLIGLSIAILSFCI